MCGSGSAATRRWHRYNMETKTASLNKESWIKIDGNHVICLLYTSSILEVKNLSHGFGDRAIFEDVSFRLLKGEHIGLVGANGEGKSTFMSIVTGKMQPDEGKVEWSKYVTAGYLDQHSVLEEGQTVRDVLRTAFDELFTACCLLYTSRCV